MDIFFVQLKELLLAFTGQPQREDQTAPRGKGCTNTERGGNTHGVFSMYSRSFLI